MATENPKDTWYAGNKRVLRYSVVDEADAVLDLSGYTVRWALARAKYTGTARIAPADEPPVLQRISTTPGHMVITAATGVVDVIIAEGLSAALLGLYYAELEVVDASNNSCVVAIGLIEVLKNLPNT